MSERPAWGAGPDERPAGRPSERVRDILRLEPFGALFWSRQTQQYTVVNRPLAELLLDARERSLVDLLVEQPDRWPGSDAELATEIAGWQREGYLDTEFRCRARLVANAQVAAALSAPLSTALFATNSCNLECAHCFATTERARKREPISVAMARSLGEELVELGCPHLVVAGGEPMVRRDFWELIEALADLELVLRLCTNGTLVTTESARRLSAMNLSTISVSLDGPDAATHDAVRGPGAFGRATRGIRALVGAGAFVQVRVTVTAPIVDRLRDFGRLANELGARVLDIKPFKATGAAIHTLGLEVPIQRYHEAIDAAVAGWPEGDCEVRIGSGMPSRLPGWTAAMRPFSCNGGTTRATVLGDGRVVACGAVTADDDWRLGEHGLAECWRHAPSILRWRSLEAGTTCAECSLLSPCGGGCRARALGAGLGFADADPWCPGD